MERYGTAGATPASMLKNGTYGDEIMDANWNPAAAYLFQDLVQCATSPELPADLTTVDVDSFLARIYSLES